MDHPVYYHLLLLLLPTIIRKSVHQKCMIIIILYSIDTVRETRVVQVKMVKFCVFCFFPRKKELCFLMIVCLFLCFFDFLTKKCYLWLIFIVCWEKKVFASTCERKWKKILTTYLSLKKTFLKSILLILITVFRYDSNQLKKCVWMETKK